MLNRTSWIPVPIHPYHARDYALTEPERVSSTVKCSTQCVCICVSFLLFYSFGIVETFDTAYSLKVGNIKFDSSVHYLFLLLDVMLFKGRIKLFDTLFVIVNFSQLLKCHHSFRREPRRLCNGLL